MRIVYIADDGTEFNNEGDCYFYEYKLKHPHLSSIGFYDKKGDLLSDCFSEDTYNATEKVVIRTNEELIDLQSLIDYTGFCCFGTITEVGTWVWCGDKDEFVKV